MSGDVEPRTGITNEDKISGSTVIGAVGSGRDSYAFSGEITAFNYNGDASFYLNKAEVLPAELLPRTLTIEGVNTRTKYVFRTSNGIGPTSGLTGEDHIDAEHSSARGAVRSGGDSYRFAGEITEFSMSSDARLTVDGRRVDVTALLPRTLTIEGSGSRAEYTFGVSGGIAGRYGHSGEDGIDINRGRVSGAVGGGRDSYAFSGELTDFELDGDATISLDGKRFDPADLLPRTVTISGDGSRTTYSVTVSGDLKPNAGITSEDKISGSTVIGAVGGGRDSYAFSGEIISISVEGGAGVYLDGERVDLDVQGAWVQKAKLPAEQSDSGGGVLNGELYYFGGFEEGHELNAVSRTFVYNPAANGGAWRRVDNLPRAVWAPCGVATEDAVYSFGGAPSV